MTGICTYPLLWHQIAIILIGKNRWVVVEGIAGMVEEEERLVGLVIANPCSE